MFSLYVCTVKQTCVNIVIDLTAIKLGKVFERMKEEYIIGQPKKDRSRTINLRQVAKKSENNKCERWDCCATHYDKTFFDLK